MADYDYGGVDLAFLDAPKALIADRELTPFAESAPTNYLGLLALRYRNSLAGTSFWRTTQYLLRRVSSSNQGTKVQAEKGLFHGGAMAMRAIDLIQPEGLAEHIGHSSFERAVGVRIPAQQSPKVDPTLAIRAAANGGLELAPGLVALVATWTEGEREAYRAHVSYGLGLVVMASIVSVGPQTRAISFARRHDS